MAVKSNSADSVSSPDANDIISKSKPGLIMQQKELLTIEFFCNDDIHTLRLIWSSFRRGSESFGIHDFICLLLSQSCKPKSQLPNSWGALFDTMQLNTTSTICYCTYNETYLANHSFKSLKTDSRTAS